MADHHSAMTGLDTLASVPAGVLTEMFTPLERFSDLTMYYEPYWAPAAPPAIVMAAFGA
jgi:hypothetical protein